MDVPHSETQWPWKLELVRRDGAVIGYALVDEGDYALYSKFVWRFDARGYARATRAPGVEEHLHRVVMGLRNGDRRWVDHINRDRLDDRRANLRLVTPAVSAQNRATYGRSRFRGVSWHPWGSWTAGAMVLGRAHKLGNYLCETTAAIAAESFRRTHLPYAPATDELAVYGDAIASGALVCGGCGEIVRIREARYWQTADGRSLCQACNGYVKPKRGPKFKPPRTCSNCGRQTTHSKRGRCDTCYAFWRRNGSDRVAA